jgi:hypothetical protein
MALGVARIVVAFGSHGQQVEKNCRIGAPMLDLHLLRL